MTVTNYTLAALWYACGVFTVGGLIFLFRERSYAKAKQFYYTTAVMHFLAAAGYFLMAVQPAPSYKNVNFISVIYGNTPATGGSFRQFYWMRYFMWALTSPFILMDIGMLANLDFWETFLLMVVDVVMIFCGFVAAMEYTIFWQSFALGMASFIFLMFRLSHLVNESARCDNSDDRAEKMNWCLLITLISWVCYPIATAMCVKNVMSENAEVVVFAILDIVSKAVFGFVLLGDEDLLFPQQGQAMMTQMQVVG
jgi:bacteriorhodopsin